MILAPTIDEQKIECQSEIHHAYLYERINRGRLRKIYYDQVIHIFESESWKNDVNYRL